MMLREALDTVVRGGTIPRTESRDVFSTALTGETDPVLLGGFLSALASRGETPAEIAGAVDGLTACMVPFEHDHEDAIDTAGTGGDGLGTFNLSTAAAIVAAACGARVIKHGNRAVSSSCGSADLLRAAGVPLELTPSQARVVLDEVGITFLLAPLYHPVLRHAAPVRTSLGVRTVLNLLGPLLNPGRVRRQVLGVSDPRRVEQLGQVLASLGHRRSYVVHGAGGADELTLAGSNAVHPVGDAPPCDFDAARLTLTRAPVGALRGADADGNLRLLHSVLDGEPGPLADAVTLNAGAALVVAGVADDPAEGVERARVAVFSGQARQTLVRWTTVARAVAGGSRP